MSIEIEENYEDLKGFYFLLSLTYEKFALLLTFSIYIVNI